MYQINTGDSIRCSDPPAGFPHFSLTAQVTGSIQTLPATLSATVPVPCTCTITGGGGSGSVTVQVLIDQVSAATYQSANPSVPVGHP